MGIAFITEGLLLGFHLKGAPIEILVHKILVITIAGTAVVMFAEICSKGSVILTLGRALLLILQGIWFIQIGYILFKGAAYQLDIGLVLPAIESLLMESSLTSLGRSQTSRHGIPTA